MVKNSEQNHFFYRLRQGRILIPIVVLAISLLVANWIANSDKKPSPNVSISNPIIVTVSPLDRSQARPIWQTNGLVIPAAQTMLMSQQAGVIAELSDNAIPGEILPEGAILAQLDTVELNLQLAQRQAGLAQALARLDIEKGKASLARRESQLAGGKFSTNEAALLLREPQIAVAEAEVEIAKTALALAETQLDQAIIRMPYRGQILSRTTSVGNFVNPSSPLFETVSVDQFWVEIKLPRQFLNYLDQQADVRVYPLTDDLLTGGGIAENSRSAKILKVLSKVDSRDRQVRLIVAIDNPLADLIDQLPTESKEISFPPVGRVPPILLNDFIAVELQGVPFKDHYQINRDQLIDDKKVWVVNDNRLRLRQLDISYIDRDFAWVKAGFEDGDQLLITSLNLKAEGLTVQIKSSASDTPADISVGITSPDITSPDTTNPDTTSTETAVNGDRDGQ